MKGIFRAVLLVLSAVAIETTADILFQVGWPKIFWQSLAAKLCWLVSGAMVFAAMREGK